MIWIFYILIVVALGVYGWQQGLFQGWILLICSMITAHIFLIASPFLFKIMSKLPESMLDKSSVFMLLIWLIVLSASICFIQRKMSSRHEYIAIKKLEAPLGALAGLLAGTILYTMIMLGLAGSPIIADSLESFIPREDMIGTARMNLKAFTRGMDMLAFKEYDSAQVGKYILCYTLPPKPEDEEVEESEEETAPKKPAAESIENDEQLEQILDNPTPPKKRPTPQPPPSVKQQEAKPPKTKTPPVKRKPKPQKEDKPYNPADDYDKVVPLEF